MEDVRLLLGNASEEEKTGLAEVLDAQSSSTEHIVEAFWWNCQSFFDYLMDEPSYSRIVHQVAQKLGIQHYMVRHEDLEAKIAQKALRTAWEEMTPEQRTKVDAELKRSAREFDKGGTLAGSASAFGALTAAQLSGFGIYMASSTALGFLTGTVGLTLPFAAYTTMSSVIGVVIGPVGWVGAGLFGIWKLTGPNYKRLVPAVLYLAALRVKNQEGLE